MISKKEYHRYFRRGGLTIIALLKSFFMAVTQTAWQLAGMFIMNLALAYFLKEGIPAEVNKLFLQLEMFIFNNLMLFVICFFILYFYSELKEIWNNHVL